LPGEQRNDRITPTNIRSAFLTQEGVGLPPQRQFVKYEHRKTAVPKDQVTAQKGAALSRSDSKSNLGQNITGPAKDQH